MIESQVMVCSDYRHAHNHMECNQDMQVAVLNAHVYDHFAQQQLQPVDYTIANLCFALYHCSVSTAAVCAWPHSLLRSQHPFLNSPSETASYLFKSSVHSSFVIVAECSCYSAGFSQACDHQVYIAVPGGKAIDKTAKGLHTDIIQAGKALPGC